MVEPEQEGWAETTDASDPEEPGGRGLRSYNLIGAYARIWVVSLGAMALAFAIFMLLRLF